nr:replication protein P [Methylomarinum sp. Ch1-1]MDP4523187.1 replication protein P [Methylomarinum sp. Ch1-1]
MEHYSKGFFHLRKSRNTFVPTIAEFIDICQKCALREKGIPSAEDAYQEACKNAYRVKEHQWQHPIVLAAARLTGWFDIKGGTQKEVFPVFKKHYDALLLDMRNGKNLPAFEERHLPESEESELATKEVGVQYLKRARKLLN